MCIANYTYMFIGVAHMPFPLSFLAAGALYAAGVFGLLDLLSSPSYPFPF